jgi:hypothetical protein
MFAYHTWRSFFRSGSAYHTSRTWYIEDEILWAPYPSGIYELAAPQERVRQPAVTSPKTAQMRGGRPAGVLTLTASAIWSHLEQYRGQDGQTSWLLRLVADDLRVGTRLHLSHGNDLRGACHRRTVKDSAYWYRADPQPVSPQYHHTNTLTPIPVAGKNPNKEKIKASSHALFQRQLPPTRANPTT